MWMPPILQHDRLESAGYHAIPTPIAAGKFDVGWIVAVDLNNGACRTSAARFAGFANLADFPIDLRTEHLFALVKSRINSFIGVQTKLEGCRNLFAARLALFKICPIAQLLP